MRLEKITSIDELRNMAPSLSKAQVGRPWNEDERSVAHKELIKSINHKLDSIRESADEVVKVRIGKLQNTIEVAPPPTSEVTPTTQSLAAKFIRDLSVEIESISKLLDVKQRDAMDKVRYEIRGAFEV